MKKSMKRAAALALSAVMATGLLAGCGGDSGSAGSSAAGSTAGSTGNAGSTGSSGGAIDTSEHVDLKMYLLGDRTPDFDEVYAEINKILEEKLNCSVSVDFLSWGEHDTKYSLLFSGGEDFDLIFTASSWGHYEPTVSMGGFYPLTEEFIQTYAPDIWDVVPEVAWSQAKIDGTAYMVPNYQNEFGQDVLAVRGDLMEQYGVSQITNWDELMDFYKKCGENGQYASQGGPWYQYFQNQGYTITGGAPKGGEMILYNTQDPSDLSFTYILDWEGFSDYCHQMKELADAGCWSQDVLSDSAERQDGLLNGRTAGMIWNLGSCRNYAEQANKEHSDWNVTLVDPVAAQPKKVNSYINNGMAINVSSRNPERAMMVLNEFYTNPTINDLTRFGIEGKHWEAIGDDQFKVIDETNFGVDSNCNWGWMNAEIKRTEYKEDRTFLDDVYDEMLESWESNIKEEHVYDGFNFDSTNVTTQMAAVDAVIPTYCDPLINGLVPDVDKALEDFRKAMETAGIRDIIAELEKQAAEYVASK
ncbi:MAG: ABC transporter substrate-binding protein [Eubacterium sp.]|nr:ABC transporter substrate-binding protein [Eubacterium sp.]MCM1217733.1 ABC transporter substrate-binding protein [Lachnospiraceae bacterium]MCM1303375.1 ABC transporter substrate-binding protein [Butyrivibrio sp.]MCM1342572.1 ABC transporter substrate-binding protein [Muribaculaceae bacterium]MCM1238178.1 ABC transporter substrate-binding protein [Lachnospiraceae bacterium]